MSKHYDWCEIRTQYEGGATIRSLIEQFGCRRRSIEMHARSGNWKRPAGWSPMVASDGRAEGHMCDLAMPKTAAEVQARHRADWQKLRALHDRAVEIAKGAQTEAALTFAKTVRTLIDGMRIIEQGERAAWAISDAMPQLDEVSDSDLEQAIQEAAARLAEARQRRDGDTDNGCATIH